MNESWQVTFVAIDYLHRLVHSGTLAFRIEENKFFRLRLLVIASFLSLNYFLQYCILSCKMLRQFGSTNNKQ